VNPVVTVAEILHARELVDEVEVHDAIRDYIVNIVFATRYPVDFKLNLKHLIQFGASPRATLALTVAAKAWALLQGRTYVTPQDVKNIGPDVLRHRVILSYEAESQGVTSDAIIKTIFDTLPVP
jgi:MoxR-like ATPase